MTVPNLKIVVPRLLDPEQIKPDRLTNYQSDLLELIQVAELAESIIKKYLRALVGDAVKMTKEEKDYIATLGAGLTSEVH
jgi:hypothetical protein